MFNQNFSKALNYRADIDGLRALAVLSVVIYHFFPKILRGGFIGVDIFFVISGFLIARIIFTHLNENRFSFLSFYSHRIRRIFPALILVLFSTFIFGKIIFFDDEFLNLSKHIFAGSAFFLIFYCGMKAVILIPLPNSNRFCIFGVWELKNNFILFFRFCFILHTKNIFG